MAVEFPITSSRDEFLRWANEKKNEFDSLVPLHAALGIETVEFADSVAVMRLPYGYDLVGNSETGVIHGGVITTLMDASSGAAVWMHLMKAVPIATLDLRIDYLRPADPEVSVVCRATCYKSTRNVAFTRAIAFHDNEADPIASATGTFMLATKTVSIGGS